MKLVYWNAEKEFGPGHKNFGDDLNKSIWAQHLPGFFDHDEQILFYGIGTILSPSAPKKPMKVVMGSGARGDQKLEIDGSYEISFVRGPKTAALINNSARFITDPAILVATLPLPKKTPSSKYGFMPHVRQHLSIGPILEKVCKTNRVKYISPDADPHFVIEEIRSVEMMICEAMHGAIVSDALNIPWVPVFTRLKPHSFKWQDWAESLKLAYNPTSMRDYSVLLRKMTVKGNSLNYISELCFNMSLKRVLKNPQLSLSDGAVRTQKINQVLDKLQDFKKKFGRISPRQQ